MQTNDRGQRLVSDLQQISDFATPPVTRNDRALAERLGLFNADWYCAEYPDVVACGADPFTHYMQYGWREGRKPVRCGRLAFALAAKHVTARHWGTTHVQGRFLTR